MDRTFKRDGYPTEPNLSGSVMANEWIKCETRLPPDNIPVETKIDDGKGCRNEAVLKRRGRLWFFADDSMYVYYRPTHWRVSAT